MDLKQTVSVLFSGLSLPESLFVQYSIEKQEYLLVFSGFEVVALSRVKGDRKGTPRFNLSNSKK